MACDFRGKTRSAATIVRDYDVNGDEVVHSGVAVHSEKST